MAVSSVTTSTLVDDADDTLYLNSESITLYVLWDKVCVLLLELKSMQEINS